MVRAILDGRKTQTRRILKQATGPSLSVDCEDGIAELSWLYGDGPGHEAHECIKRVACPYGLPADCLWVRETHEVRLVGTETWPNGKQRHYAMVRYRADDNGVEHDIDGATHERLDSIESRGWAPSIHMPRWASRILLEITGVRVERLDDCSESDARAEGVRAWSTTGGGGYQNDGETAREQFVELWNSINGAGAWKQNPWVWVVEFRRVQA